MLQNTLKSFEDGKFSLLSLSSFLIVFGLGAALISAVSFIWPISLSGYLIKPFGYIKIIKKKLKDHSDFTLLLNGTEIYKQNGNYHRELQKINGKHYFLPAYVKRTLPNFFLKNKNIEDYFEKDFKNTHSHKWYFLGQLQELPDSVFIHNDNLQEFKEQYQKERIRIINQNF